MMKKLIDIRVNNNGLISGKIARFYINAKKKYPHSYGWDEVYKDFYLARTDMNLKCRNATNPTWANNGYGSAVNDKGWVYAYTLEEKTDANGNLIGYVMILHDVENQQNLNNLYDNHDILSIPKPKKHWNMGYGIHAYRMSDGYIHLVKNRKLIPNCRFNEVIDNFRRRENGEVYAIVDYGGGRCKITLSGGCTQILESFIRRIARRVISELRRRFGRKSLVG